MSSTTNRRLDDLASLLVQSRFTHQHADYKESRTWRIFVYPRKGKGDLFDALVCVIPRRGPESLGAELPLTVNGRGCFWLAEDLTSAKGQVWFHDLPPGEYSLHLGTMPLPITAIAKRSPKVLEANARSGFPDARNVNSRADAAWPSYVLHDRRISAALRMEKSGLAVLTWKAIAPELTGIRIDFHLAGEDGEVILRPSGRSTRPTARWLMQQSYKDVVPFLPRFSINVKKGRRAGPKS